MRNKLYSILLLGLLFAFGAYAQEGKLLNTSYTPSFTEGTIETFLADIQLKTTIPVSFSASSIDPKMHVRMRGNEQTIGDALNTMLAGQPVSVAERRDKILIVPRGTKKRHLRTEQYTLNGYIKEENTKEALIGAIVYVPGIGAGTATNSFGFYSLTVPEGDYKVVSSYLGFRSDTSRVSLKQNTRKDLFLQADNQLEEVKITRKTKETHDHKHILLNDIEGAPALLGESDVMRTIQNTAGVVATTDGMSTILVRGGDPGQNLFLLDGVPVYYADHMSGLTSVFSLDAIKSVDFYKGAFPARFGGRLASVVDVNTKDGDMERIGGQFTFGLVKSSLNLEGPIVKDKASVMLSARRTWIDALWRPFTDDIGFNFYDVNAKVNYIVNPDNRLYLSFYKGRDRIAANTTINDNMMTWGNTIGSARWASILNPRLFVNTTVSYSRFNFQLREGNLISTGGQEEMRYNTGRSLISDYAGKVQLHYYPDAYHHIEAGINYAYSDFNPTSVEPEGPLATTNLNLNVNRFQSNEVTLFAEDEIKLGDKWVLRPGLHWANWFNKDYNYSSLQPRIYAAYKPGNKHTLYGSFSQMAQYLHFINSNTFGVPVGFYLPSTSRIEPEEALLGTLGYAASYSPKFSYNVELYYKDILNVTTFDIGKDIFDNNIGWEEKIAQGKGWSYGAEFSAQTTLGPFRASAAYTLSWTWRQFASQNNGEAFPFRYDRRHNIRTGLTYEPNKRFSATANWMYMSGEAITLPDQLAPDLDNNLLVNVRPGGPVQYTYNYASFNDYRLPPIHRLDVGFNFRKQKRKYMERIWSLGVFNAYARRNIMIAEFESTGSFNTYALKGMSFLQFIPYLTYKLKF